LRTEPSALSQQIGLIGWGTVVRLLEVDASGQWYRVEADGVVGWSLAGWFEAYQGEAAVSSSPSSGQTDTPNTGASSSQTLSNSNGTGTVRAVGTIRIRQAPHTNSAILGQMAWGDQALLLGMDASRYWAQVNFDGVVGWVNVGWLEITPGEVRVP